MKKDARIKTATGLVILFCSIGLVSVGYYLWPKIKYLTIKKDSPKVVHQPAKPISEKKIKEPEIPVPIKFFIKVSAREENGKISTSGDSNLPNGSTIIIKAFRLYTVLEDSYNYEGALGSAQTTLYNGKYNASFGYNDLDWYEPVVKFYKLINREIKPAGSREYNFKEINDYITINAVFDPVDQTDQIKEAVGPYGEKLTGDNLYQNGEGTTILKNQFELESPFNYPELAE